MSGVFFLVGLLLRYINFSLLLLFFPSALSLSEDFIFRKNIPSYLRHRCISQNWKNIVLRTGLKEGNGVIATNVIQKGTVVCNYGGHFMPYKYVKKHLLPYENMCDYLLEIKENFRGKYRLFYLNHDEKSSETFGKYLNHSKKHPNVAMKIYADGKKLEVIFVTLREITKNEQLVWDYGNSYGGVADCVENCTRCN